MTGAVNDTMTKERWRVMQAPKCESTVGTVHSLTALEFTTASDGSKSWRGGHVCPLVRYNTNPGGRKVHPRHGFL